MCSACIPHVLGMYIRNGCRRVADQTPKASRSIPKRCGRRRRLRIGPRRLPEGLRMTLKGCGRVAEGFPNACGAPKAVPIKKNRVQILKLLKVRCRRYSDPESVPKASRWDAEGFPIISKACRRYAEGGEFAIFAFGNPSGS